MDDYMLHTPEQVDISYTLAGVGSRFLAALIDSIIQGVLLFVLYHSVTYRIGNSLQRSLVQSARGNLLFDEWYTAIVIILIAIICYGYYLILELLMKGRTPGKAAMGIRVARMDGRAVDISGTVLRNLVRIIDMLPIFYVVGIVAMFVNRDSRRLGDLAAGTVVIVERKQTTLSDIVSTQAQMAGSGIDSLSNQEYAVIRDFIARRSDLTQEAKLRLAASIAVPLYDKLGVPRQNRQDPETFLCQLMNAPK